VLLPAATGTPRYQPGVVLVGLRPGVASSVLRALTRAVSARKQQPLGFIGSATRAARSLQRRIGASFVLRVPSGTVLSAVAWLRRRRRLVRYAEPNYLMQPAGATTTPNDPSFNLQWGSLNTGQPVNGISGTPGADDHAAQAWTQSTGSRSIVIGEVDTGVDYNHPDLAANIWSNPGGIGGCPAGTHGYNVLNSSCDPMDTDVSFNGHGTHVAGIMGAVGNNGAGVAGMNWSTTILPVRWVSDDNGSNTTSNLISALDWLLKAEQAGVNVRVVNDSTVFIGTASSQALSDEIDALGANNILFVTAAGNTGQNNDDPRYTRYPCGYDRPSEICVTATNQSDQLPTWANYGPNTTDLAAPGDNIYSTLRNGTYGYINGTSMASPQVAGAAALILSVQNFSTTALKADILNNVRPLASLSGLVRTGGILDVCKAMPGCSSPAPPPASTLVPASPTQAPASPTQAPASPTQAPASPTQAPASPTQAASRVSANSGHQKSVRVRIELKVCTQVRRHSRKITQCRTRRVPRLVSLPASAAARARLKRGQRVYASGATRTVRGRRVVLLVAHRSLPGGSYVLVLQYRHRIGSATAERVKIAIPA
jgi:subtilisin family serine protease